MKKKQRKSYTAALKVKIALETIKGRRTINEIATHYGVHPNQAPQWKKQAALESARCLLDPAGTRRPTAMGKRRYKRSMEENTSRKPRC